MKVSDYVIEYLHRRGVTHVFEVVGGMITHLVDSLNKHGGIEVVSVHHEQAAAFAAEGYGRQTGRPGVAMATSGPGATNLLTGIGSCYFDSVPAIFITGQVNRSEQKGDRKIRQLGFQETDIVSMATPIVKAAWKIASANEVPERLAQAFELATSGRPGPVLIDLPMDVQRESVDPVFPEAGPSAGASREVDAAEYAAILEAIRGAKKPMLLVGGGMRSGRCHDLFVRAAERLRVPVACSLMAVDALPFGHELRVGLIGSYGNRWANTALGGADVLLVVGSRLDVRQTGSETAAFSSGKTIFHVDCEPGEINNRVLGCRAIVSELRPFLEGLLRAMESIVLPEHLSWKAEIEELRRRWPDTSELTGVDGINPNVFLHQLSHASRKAGAFVVDVGQHQMWAGQSLELGPDQRFMTSGGMGAMGFSLPAALGVCFADERRPVVVIAGDGGFQLNLQEFQTIVRNGLPVKIALLNNRCHGMVRQFQESYFDGRYQSTMWGYSAPDFAKVAGAYGISAETVDAEAEVPAALARLWADPSAPGLLQVMIDPRANAYPKIAFGLPITEMEPQAKPKDMEGT